MGMRILFLLLCSLKVWATPQHLTLYSNPDQALIYVLGDGQTADNLPVPAGFQLPPGRVVGKTGEPVEVDFGSNSTVWCYLLHQGCQPEKILLKSSGAPKETFVLNALAQELTVTTEPAGAIVYQVQNGVGQTVPQGLPTPADYKLPPGKVLGGSNEPLSVQSASGNLQLILLHEQCVPYSLNVTLPAQPKVQLSYRNSRGFSKLQFGLLVVPLAMVAWLMRKSRLQNLQLSRLEEQKRTVEQMVSSSSDPYVGRVLEGYRILQLLGLGGMARVYRAVPRDSLDESQAVAMKVLNQQAAADADLRARFEREMRVYNELIHPNIVRVLESGLYDGQMYLVMEMVQGSTLRAYVFEGGISPKKMLDLMAPVLQAVHFAHKKGIVHRDLKPENIMMTDKNVIKVMDFGLARSSQFSKLTATGSILGTPAYMSPEQIEGKLHPATDQYALGVMIYELLTGKLPFYDENPVTLILEHLSKAVPPLAEKRPDLAKVAPVVERMLAKAPLDRFADLEHALKALRFVV